MNFARTYLHVLVKAAIMAPLSLSGGGVGVCSRFIENSAVRGTAFSGHNFRTESCAKQ